MLKMRFLRNGLPALLVVFLFIFNYGCENTNTTGQWDNKYDFMYDMPRITFHYDHGILAGSYPDNRETVDLRFNDICQYLGHVCLCGAGGYKISEKALNLLTEPGKYLERGDFMLISSNDHTISDVIAYVLGCVRRDDPEKNQYFIDPDINSPRREYHYYIAYIPQRKAVHITYRKHLLVGNERMDSLWKVELAYEDNPASVSKADVALYQQAMFNMVNDVLFERKEGLFETEMIDYDKFLSDLTRLKAD